MRRSYKYKLYPNKAQRLALAETLETHRHLYNDALAERKDAWETEQKSISWYDQKKSLTANRKINPYLGATTYGACSETLHRLDCAFHAFFRRVKAGETPGYPRFKARNRFDSFGYERYGNGFKIKDGRLVLHNIGALKVKWHRVVPEDAVIKTASIKSEPNGWHVVFSCELPDVDTRHCSDLCAGIDLGLKSFLVTSDGCSIDPPKLYRKAQDKERRLQRAIARKKKGSNRRRKAVSHYARQKQHVKNQRSDFHHKVVVDLVRKYGMIAHEDLNIKGLARTRLAKSITDVAWGQFLFILAYKAAEAGTRVIAVPPKNTTQACSECGSLPETRLTLRDRVYCCAHCGQVSDRDLNAARNILRLGLSLQALTQQVTASVA